MVGVEPECALWFQGTDAPAALVEVSVYGGAEPDAYDALTARVCELLDAVLDIDPARVYVKIAKRPTGAGTAETSERGAGNEEYDAVLHRTGKPLPDAAPHQKGQRRKRGQVDRCRRQVRGGRKPPKIACCARCGRKRA